MFSAQSVAEIRGEIQALEAQYPKPTDTKDLNQFFRVNGHLVIPMLADLARTPEILNAIETILGPNPLVWLVELFIKEAQTKKTVSWHQDITYWGMGETDDEVTAWVALSDVSVQAGCMRFILGSHRNPIVSHHDTYDDNNLLSRGQEITGINENDAVYGALRPGEMSLHHGRCFHASGPNMSDNRRIGLAIRYVTPDVRHEAPKNDYAMLVRGCDATRGWINVAGPLGLFDASDLEFYDQVLAEQSATLAAGAATDVGLYSAT